jgi:hypothetical protein
MRFAESANHTWCLSTAAFIAESEGSVDLPAQTWAIAIDAMSDRRQYFFRLHILLKVTYQKLENH